MNERFNSITSVLLELLVINDGKKVAMGIVVKTATNTFWIDVSVTDPMNVHGLTNSWKKGIYYDWCAVNQTIDRKFSDIRKNLRVDDDYLRDNNHFSYLLCLRPLVERT